MKKVKGDNARAWIKILPYFVVEWMCKRWLSRHVINTMSSGWDQRGVKTVVSPFRGIYMTVDEETPK